MKKRATALLLILLMVVSLLPVLGTGAVAAEKTVEITPANSNSPEETISIDVGDTLIINVKNGSSSNSYDFTATLSKSGVAEIQGSNSVSIAASGTGTFTVTGLKDGTVNINITNGGSYARKGTVYLTVGNGDPELPPADKTVDITPTTSNPEVTASIDIGETLGINVSNTSTNSGYDYTATPNSSGIIQFLSDSTITIAKSSTGQFMVEGLADGTVDIAISNGNSSSERKGVIHLTVGAGGSTPVDPPAGNTVSITPSTSNPAESISIDAGETFAIIVTNSSTRSGYDYTATLSKSGVAEIQGSATITIEAGSTGTFMVKGLADGTVDINISNNNSSSERKGTIHLTVGDGGSTPVDPPAGNTVSITPTTDNPSESISISVGDTLTIKVTNSSSNSAYDYTATLSNTGIAEIQGNSTVNIGMSGTGTFTVEGLADGTVDITIQNNSSYGSQYIRTGVIHLTVGEGGSTPVDPPVGEDKTYVQATTLEDGKNYLIVSGNTGAVYVLGNETTGSGNNAGLKGIAATADNGKITLSAVDAAKAEFKAEIKTSDSGAVSAWLEQGGNYLYTASSNGLRISNEQTSSSNTGKFWHYKAEEKNLLWFFKDTSSSDGYTDTSSTYKYYLDLSGGNFISKNVSTTSLANTTTTAVYLFVEDEGTQPATVPVTGVTLDKSAMSLTVGGSGTLTATVAPDNATNKNVTWISSDEAVAAVNASGTVTAVAVGTATITATTEDGEKTATCSVTVTEPQEMVASVSELMKLKDSTVWLIQVKEENGKGITYKGDAMVWSSRYEAYVITAEGETAPVPAAADFAVSGDAAAAVVYPTGENDANGSKKTDMSDVQYIYNLYKGKYDGLNAAGGLAKVLGADVNGDGKIDSSDAAKVLTALREAAI